jgi:hypothetical protein
MGSIRSSSGVSSTTSLFHCVSDLETTPETISSHACPPHIDVSEPDEPLTSQFEDETETEYSGVSRDLESTAQPSETNQSSLDDIFEAKLEDRNHVGLPPEVLTSTSKLGSKDFRIGATALESS